MPIGSRDCCNKQKQLTRPARMNNWFIVTELGPRNTNAELFNTEGAKFDGALAFRIQVVDKASHGRRALPVLPLAPVTHRCRRRSGLCRSRRISRFARRRPLGIAGKGKMLAMNRDKIPHASDRMRVLQCGDQRAVHRRLLVLLEPGKVGSGDTVTMAAHHLDFARPYGALT